MNPEIERELEEIHALAKDNHRMLRAIRRGQWFSFFSSIIFWLAVLVLPLYLYQQYLAPIISKISETTGMSTTTTSGLFNVPAFTEIGKVINSFTAGH
jgi:hypothetical protein